MRCSAKNCRNYPGRKVLGVSFHQFPKCKQMLQKWLTALGVDEKNELNTRWIVCSDHFAETCFLPRLDPNKRRILKNSAEPTLLLDIPNSEDPNIISNMSHITSEIKMKLSKNSTKAVAKRKVFRHKWSLETKFPDEKTAIDYLNAEGSWTKHNKRKYAVLGGYKVQYQCKRAKFKHKPCSAIKCLFYIYKSGEVWLYKTDTVHNHDKISEDHIPKTIRKTRYVPLKNDIKIRIVQLMKELQAPEQIIIQLESEGFYVKNLKNLANEFVLNIQDGLNENNWMIENSFNVIDDVINYLKCQKIWSFTCKTRSSAGNNYYYRCNLVPTTGPQCKAEKYFNINKYTNKITLYQNDSPHTHSTGNLQQTNINKHDSFLNKLSDRDRISLIQQEFRVLDAVVLQNCLVDKTLDIDKTHSDDQKSHFTSDWTFETKIPIEKMTVEYLAQYDITEIDPNMVCSVLGDHKEYYRCNQKNKTGLQCAAWKCLIYYVNSNDVFLYKKNKHTHTMNSCQREKNNNKHEDTFELVTGDDSFQYIINYIPDEQTITNNNEKANCNSIWVYDNSFPSSEEAKQYLDESNFSIVETSTINFQTRIYYRCNRVNKFGLRCDAQFYVIHCTATSNFKLYRNLAQHIHNPIVAEKKNVPLPTGILKKIQRSNESELISAATVISLHAENTNEVITPDNQLMKNLLTFNNLNSRILIPDSYLSSENVVKED